MRPAGVPGRDCETARVRRLGCQLERCCGFGRRGPLFGPNLIGRLRTRGAASAMRRCRVRRIQPMRGVALPRLRSGVLARDTYPERSCCLIQKWSRQLSADRCGGVSQADCWRRWRTRSAWARREVRAAVTERYALAGRCEKGRILDELTAVTGWRRKHAARALSASRSLRPEEAATPGDRPASG